MLYTWVVPLKDKKCISDEFQDDFDVFGRKTNKIWLDKGSKFYIHQ